MAHLKTTLHDNGEPSFQMKVVWDDTQHEVLLFVGDLPSFDLAWEDRLTLVAGLCGVDITETGWKERLAHWLVQDLEANPFS